MPSSTRTARRAAALLLVQLAGLIVPFALLVPVVAPDYLALAATRAAQFDVAVGLLALNGLVTVAIAALLWSVVREATEVGAVLLVAASVVMFGLQMQDNAHLRTMLALSQQYVSGGARRDLLDVVGAAVRTTRRGTHYAALFGIELWMWALYGALLRAKAVPRALAILGLVTATLHFIGVVLPYHLGQSSIPSLAPLMGVSQLVLVARLLMAGFQHPGSSPLPSSAVPARESR